MIRLMIEIRDNSHIHIEITLLVARPPSSTSRRVISRMDAASGTARGGARRGRI